MRSPVLICLAVGWSLLDFGWSLQCYSCPHGSSSSCDVIHDCNNHEDGCLKLTSAEKTYSRCITYADCDFLTLAAKYFSLSDFTFSCCQSNLCNSQVRSWTQRLHDFWG
ncbi:CD59 glycoprotein-like isoform X2 [Dunckerocampus dactyliophorus]|uniref:CD59 glycoprotein-like isoform X2 n=1 Tax=Dunckerocampus dactyliophorus TaxID=161453 RepID=UPI002405D882|nr:CD59 glycoprotein-like isoform X2 [Dunckerocampus dactyliophorus]